MEEQIGVFYSKEWVVKNVLQMSDDDYNEMKEQMEQEKAEAPDDELDI